MSNYKNLVVTFLAVVIIIASTTVAFAASGYFEKGELYWEGGNQDKVTYSVLSDQRPSNNVNHQKYVSVTVNGASRSKGFSRDKTVYIDKAYKKYQSTRANYQFKK